MKKTAIFIATLVFAFHSFSVVQSQNLSHKDLIGDQKYTFLKEFKIELEPKASSRYSLVLKKDVPYVISYVYEQYLKFDLLDSNDKHLIPSHVTIQKKVIDGKEVPVTHLKYVFNKTGTFHMTLTNKMDSKTNSLVALSRDNRKDNTEEVIVITSNGNNKPVKEEEIFFVVEDMPKFVLDGKTGTTKDFSIYIAQNMKYPKEAYDKKVQGKVYVQFVISKEGYVTDAKVIRGVHPSLDQEALRVVYSSPKWIPGKQRGQAVNVSYTIPIIFNLK